VYATHTETTITGNLLTGLGIDEYFSRTDSAGAATILADALGSTLGLTDASGVLNTSYTYEPFGNVAISGAANANSYEFTARENDGAGLYYYRARYYSPTFQRFLSQDPLDFLGGDYNLYGYVTEDPINGIDPEGKDVIDCLKMFLKLPSLLKAQEGCQQEVNNCDTSSDDLFKNMDSLVCKQTFCSKYGAPGDQAAAVATCACRKAGEGSACVGFILDGFNCGM